jgi:hypothetical protein
MSDERSTFRKVLSLGIAFMLITAGAVILGNWLLLGGGLPKYAGWTAGIMIGVGLMIAYEDIVEWRKSR